LDFGKLRKEFQRRANYAGILEKPIFIGEWGLDWHGQDLGPWINNTVDNIMTVKPEWSLGGNVLKEARDVGTQRVWYLGKASVKLNTDYWVGADFLTRGDKEARLVGKGAGNELVTIRMEGEDCWNVANPLSEGFLKFNSGNNKTLEVRINRVHDGGFIVRNVVFREFRTRPGKDAEKAFGGIAFWAWGQDRNFAISPDNENVTKALRDYLY